MNAPDVVTLKDWHDDILVPALAALDQARREAMNARIAAQDATDVVRVAFGGLASRTWPA